MKNIIDINANGEVLVSSVNDGTNTLYINGTEINSSQWIGSGSYTATVEGHAITIAKAPDLSGNIQLIRISEYNYRLIKLRSFNNVLDVYQDGISVVGSDGIARVITGGSEVSVIADLTTGTKIGTITVDGSGTDLYAPTPPATPADYVIEEGASGSWKYRKWNSGKIEAWYEGSVTCSATTSRGNVYISTYSLTIPNNVIGFTDEPYLIIGNNANTNNIIGINGIASSVTQISGYVWRPQSSTNTLTVQLRVYAWTD